MTEATATSKRPSRKRDAKDPLGSNSEIARKLKQYYNTVVTDEVPDRFAQLLNKLESAETHQDKG
jgi:hypothetical protein